MDQARQAGAVSVSLRLSEPEEDADVWLLETVLSTATTKTTGHLLFVNIPYLLKKHYLQSGECLRLKLSKEQQQIVELLSTDTINSDIFIRVTLEDLEVRSFTGRSC